MSEVDLSKKNWLVTLVRESFQRFNVERARAGWLGAQPRQPDQHDECNGGEDGGKYDEHPLLPVGFLLSLASYAAQ